MSDKRGTSITCQNNSTNKRQTPGGLMSTYKHRSHHRFKLSWYGKPGVAALGEGGSHSPTTPGRPVGWHDHVPLGCLAPRMPIFHVPGGGRALQVGRQYLAPMGFLLKVLWLSNVTALILKLPPVAWPDLGRRQLIGERKAQPSLVSLFLYTCPLHSYRGPRLGWRSWGEGDIYWPGFFFFKVQNKTKCCLHNSAHDKANPYV